MSDDRPIPNALVNRRNYRFAWILVLMVAALLRFVDLGQRTMSFDEAQHGYFSWAFSEGAGYTHDPVHHGPLLFHLTGLALFVGGDSEALARLYPAVAGLLLVLAPFALRRRLGEIEALAAGTLIAISPSLTFYSRYLRNDVPVALYTLIWFSAAYVWVTRRSERSLWILVAAMAASFASKETAFLSGAVLGSWALFVGFASRSAEEKRAARELALLMAALVAPFGAGALAGWRGLRSGGPLWLPWELAVALAILGGALLAARLRRPGSRELISVSTWTGLVVLFWGSLSLLYTAILSNPAGLGTGIVGSLGYWLQQQDVGRGGQPPFYYAMLAALYSLLPIGLALCGAVVWFRRRARLANYPGLLLWWMVASFVLFSMAGEKMPWLLVHTVLPATLLGGVAVGRLLGPIVLNEGMTRRQLGWAAAAPALLLALWRSISTLPFQGRTPTEVHATLSWFLQIVIFTLAVAYLWRSGKRHGQGIVLRWCGIGGLALAALLTLRTNIHLSFRHQQLAIEPLVYAEGSPDLPGELTQRLQPFAGPTAIVMDTGVSWPVAWHLRDHSPLLRLPETLDPELRQVPLVIVGDERRAEVRAFLSETHEERRVRQLCWPLERYKAFDWLTIPQTLNDPDRLRAATQFLFYRRHRNADPRDWPLCSELSFLLRRSPSGLEDPPLDREVAERPQPGLAPSPPTPGLSQPLSEKVPP